MARMTKLGSIELQIQKKQERLFELKELSDTIASEIETLIMQRNEIRKAELMNELEKSGRTYEEILEFLKSAPKRDNNQPNQKRKYTKRVK